MKKWALTLVLLVTLANTTPVCKAQYQYHGRKSRWNAGGDETRSRWGGNDSTLTNNDLARRNREKEKATVWTPPAPEKKKLKPTKPEPYNGMATPQMIDDQKAEAPLNKKAGKAKSK